MCHVKINYIQAFYFTEFTVRCAGVNVIFVFDELQLDARTYYTNIIFARYLVRGMDNDAYVTLLTSSVSKSRTRLGVNFFSVKKAELTPSMWLRRFESTWTLRDLVDVCKEAKSQVVLIGVNIRHSSFFATLLTGLEFPEIINTPKIYGRIYDLLELKIYDLHYNVAMKGSDRENKDDHVTNTTITYTSKRRLAQHTITYYKNVEIFQKSFKFLQNDVCRSTRVFRPGGKSCPKHYLCSGYFEYNVNRIDFSIKSPKYSWKSVLLLKPLLRRMDFALEHLDWKSAKEACSHHGMIPLIIPNKREVKVFSQSITHYMPILAQAVARADGFDKRELIMMIGLKRSMKSIGRRFSWGEQKDLYTPTGALDSLKTHLSRNAFTGNLIEPTPDLSLWIKDGSLPVVERKAPLLHCLT
ncbi:hypothetical protein PoB_007581600 [Plakobranchus ocellatus]|uniref:Uncharacterized protein n=1 Tax=Plakobranchus ocellatus TaxID=259542 RepID=A0AAV4DYZ6_9GAST|nr:hypothetical protein PoB_007581600 [Plakobranchus ocellatus]